MADKAFLTPMGVASLFFLALAGAGLGYDVVTCLLNGGWEPVPLGQFWYSVDPGSLNLIQAVIQRYVSPAVWTPLFEVLLWPTWGLPLVIGGLLLLLKWSPWKREEG